MKTKLKKTKKELVANILFCGVLGSIAGVILGNIVNSHLFAIIGSIVFVEGMGLIVNLSLIKEIKRLKTNLTQEITEVETSEAKEEPTNLEEKKIHEKYQEKKNFVLETPISQMTLYGYEGVFYPIYFDLEEKQKFNDKSNIPMRFLHSLAFIGNFAGRKNVIRVYNQSNILDSKEYYVAMEENSYVLLNEEKSIQSKSYVWEICEQCIRGIDVHGVYLEFQKRGIVLEENIFTNGEEVELQNKMIRKISLNKKD